jgi:hypothetical protein
MKRWILLALAAPFLTACPMDFATFEVDVGDDLPDTAATYIGADKTDMTCETGQCRTGATVGADGPGRIELVYADGTVVECAIPHMDFGYSETMRFVVEERQCRLT